MRIILGSIFYFSDYEAYGSLITLNITDQLDDSSTRTENEYSLKTSHDLEMNKSIKEDKFHEIHAHTQNQIKVQSLSLISSVSSMNKSSSFASRTAENQRTNNCSFVNHQLVINLTNDINNDGMKAPINNHNDLDDYDEVNDSDSGIYSLYDSVLNKTLSLERGTELDLRLSGGQELDKKFLNDAFHEAKLLKEMMKTIRDVSAEKYSQDFIKSVKERQECLRKYLTKLELEKMENTESINNLKYKMFQETPNHLFLTKFQSLIDQIDQITNLIFGIEMKLERCSYNEFNIINTEMWTTRLSEAVEIKNKHNECLSALIRTNVSPENQFELQEKICIKQRQICQLKLIRAEIYCNEMQLKIVFV